MKKKKVKNNVINFPSGNTKLERQVEAILFSASEPLDVETIEKRIQTNTDISKIFPASTRDLVIFISLWLGFRFPDGWLWARIMAEASLSIAGLKTNRGSTTVPETPP